jgi:Ca-activated chloride channel homolog
VVITPGKHNIVGIKTPQGTLEFKMAGVNLESASIPVIIREKDKMNTLNVQMFGELTRYITGNYDLEILTLPRTYINDINISQNHTTTIEIPQPGIATFMMSARGYGSVYKQTSKGLEFVTNLSQNKDKETLSLQPGDYVSVFRPKQARESIFTVERPFKIVSGASVAIKLN